MPYKKSHTLRVITYQPSGLDKKKALLNEVLSFLAMGCEKDIFAINILLMQNVKLNPPTAAAISLERSENFTLRSNISPPARVDLVEKPTCRNKSVFLQKSSITVRKVG